ncbi:hypothetical protein [Mycobacterium sp. B14F4]|uniref:hypothetical protein n=1 Tax=Mycobacterium sp. B14F4 TaxID=3153565 RepID=UPI00325FCFD2
MKTIEDRTAITKQLEALRRSAGGQDVYPGARPRLAEAGRAVEAALSGSRLH